MNRKFKFLLVLLFTICQIVKLDAKSREIRWFDYKTALRRKINIDTYELKAEYQAGKWITVGKVNVDPLALKDLPLGFVNSYFHTANDSLLYFTIFGTGQVYEFEPKTTTLKRIDQTYYRGYNFGSVPFSRKGKLYSAGGYGFWHYSNVITSFNFDKKEWDAVIPENAGPVVINEYGFNGYSSKEDVFYSGASACENLFSDLKRFRIKQFFKYDFKNQQWTELGSINEDLLAEDTREIYWNGTYFLQWANNKLYIIDPIANEVYLYKNNERFFVTNKEYFSKGDTIYNYWSDDNGGLEYFSVKEYLKNAEYIGPFYSIGIPWYNFAIGGVFLLLILGGLVYNRKARVTLKIKLNKAERELLHALLVRKPGDFFTTLEINDILGLNAKTMDNQRRIRTNVINQINIKILDVFNIPDAIEREASEEDKRVILYRLKPQINELLDPKSI